MLTDEYFMKIALQQAIIGAKKGEVPVGAIVVMNNKIIAKSYNRVEALVDVTAHAEMQCITSASNYLGSKFLEDCVLYVTLEPCVMCAGALYWSRISRVVIGARDINRGFLQKGTSLHPTTRYSLGILEKDCSRVIQNFFKDKR